MDYDNEDSECYECTRSVRELHYMIFDIDKIISILISGDQYANIQKQVITTGAALNREKHKILHANRNILRYISNNLFNFDDIHNIKQLVHFINENGSFLWFNEKK